MAKKARQSAPAPEVIVRPGVAERFRVVDPVVSPGPIGVSADGGVMRVPLDDSPGSLWTRRHEMAHLAWSPTTAPDPKDPMAPYLQAVEDARINLRLKKQGFDTETSRPAGSIAQAMAGQNDPIATLTRVALAGTSDEAEAARALDALDRKYGAAVSKVLGILRRNLDSYDSTIEAARELARVVKVGRPQKAPGTGEAGGLRVTGKSKPEAGGGAPLPAAVNLPPMPAPPKPQKPAKAEKEEDKPADAAPKRPPLPSEMEPVTVTIVPSGGDVREFVPDYFQKQYRYAGMPSEYAPVVPWGAMAIVQPPTPLRLDRRRGRGKWRPSDSGTTPRRMERWATDQAVFTTKGRQRSGTVLIDASSSMAIPHKAILECLRTAPAATLAMYSSDVRDSTRGTLFILARRGRRVAAIPPHGGCNVVDGPALRWLAQQKAPRIWVCDGIVTGIGDKPSLKLAEESVRICQRFGIKRVKSLEDAAKVLGVNVQIARTDKGG